MAKFCGNCGNELDDKAVFCPKCGVGVNNVTNNSNNDNNVKKKKGLPAWAIILIILGSLPLIVLIIFILVGIFTYRVVTENGKSIFDEVRDEIREEFGEYNTDDIKSGTIGDTLYDDDVRLTLKNAVIYDSFSVDGEEVTPALGKKYLVFFFEVENVADDFESVSSFNFRGYEDESLTFSEYSSLEIEGYKKLNCTLARGEKDSGYIFYQVDEDFNEFEIIYDSFGDDKFSFTVTNAKE